LGDTVGRRARSRGESGDCSHQRQNSPTKP
jgi:hypothetical protein